MPYSINTYNETPPKQNPFRPTAAEINAAMFDHEALVRKRVANSVNPSNVEVGETLARINRAMLIPAFVFVRRALARTLIRGMYFKWYAEAEFLTWQDFPRGTALYDDHSPLHEMWPKDEVKRRRAQRSAPYPENYRFLERVVWLPRQGRFDVIDLVGKQLLDQLESPSVNQSENARGAFLPSETVEKIADRCERRELIFGEARLPKAKKPLAPT